MRRHDSSAGSALMSTPGRARAPRRPRGPRQSVMDGRAA